MINLIILIVLYWGIKMVEEKENSNKDINTTVSSLVFISHDTRDSELAEAFSGLLKSVSAGVLKSFRSSDRKGNQGIEFGVEWYPEIIKNIQSASDVVCLLTKKSINRPWILFEAGMAKGKLETPILGVALGISLKEASNGPFAQFQNCSDDEESLTKLVFQLVNRIPNSEPDEETIKFQVGKFKQRIEEILNSDKSNAEIDKTVNQVDENASAKLFEEIKVMFQDLPSRIDRNLSSPNYKYKSKRFHPMIFKEIMHVAPNKKIGLLICLSFIGEKFPWIYDQGKEALEIIYSNKPIKVKFKVINELEEVMLAIIRNPIIEIFSESREEFIMYN